MQTLSAVLLRLHWWDNVKFDFLKYCASLNCLRHMGGRCSMFPSKTLRKAAPTPINYVAQYHCMSGYVHTAQVSNEGCACLKLITERRSVCTRRHIIVQQMFLTVWLNPTRAPRQSATNTANVLSNICNTVMSNIRLYGKLLSTGNLIRYFLENV
jgi:hypothetical protein|uniref:Uncharacterized protein n=1 Tax=Sipha flava TaxID=143950 RepID=A0A2S2QSX5_9HEMI